MKLNLATYEPYKLLKTAISCNVIIACYMDCGLHTWHRVVIHPSKNIYFKNIKTTWQIKPYIAIIFLTCRQMLRPGIDLINTKRRHFKHQIIAFKWHLTFRKFHKTLLAFKTPKSRIFITNIGVLSAKKEAF